MGCDNHSSGGKKILINEFTATQLEFRARGADGLVLAESGEFNLQADISLRLKIQHFCRFAPTRL
jgi:hypothetical protein